MRNFVLLALVNLLWALQFPASRVASQELQPMTLTWFAMLLATILMLPVAWFERREARLPAPRQWYSKYGPVILLGISGSLVAQTCLNWGLEKSPASNASVLNLTVPVLMAILATVFLGERMSLTRWVSFGLAIPGVALASEIRWTETSFFENKHFVGNLLVFISCWGSAFYNVYSKRVLDWLGPAQLLVATFSVSLAALLPVLLIYEPDPLSRLRTASSASVVGLLLVGVLSLALAMFLYFRVLGEVEATQASLSIYFLPIFGLLLSGAALHETVSLSLIAGGVLVGAGAWLITVREPNAPTSSPLHETSH